MFAIDWLMVLDSTRWRCFNPAMPDTAKAYQSLIDSLREISVLSSVAAVLGWDERTQLPPKGTDHRATQAAMLAGMIHERFTSPCIGQWLTELEASPGKSDPESDEAVNVRETRRSYDRAVKLPPSLVEELSRTAVQAQQVWGEARAKNDYPLFAPWLEKILKLKRSEAACVGSASGNPYDALLDEFEPGESAEGVRKTFEQLREPLVELIDEIVGSGRSPHIEILERNYPAAAQQEMARKAAAAVGFDFQAGRLDTSLHPFCTGLGPGDTRMTTRYDPKYFGDAFFGVLHETGHGALRPGPGSGALRHAARRGGLAGHTRIAVCACGKISSPAAGRSGGIFFPMSDAHFPTRWPESAMRSGTRPSTTSVLP